jgi:hypothetical protein
LVGYLQRQLRLNSELEEKYRMALEREANLAVEN